MSKEIATKIYNRHDTTNNWYTKNSVLAMGESGYDSDLKLYKTGDGITAWNLLKYQKSNDSNDSDKLGGQLPAYYAKQSDVDNIGEGDLNSTDTYSTLNTTDKTILGAINENFTNVSGGLSEKDVFAVCPDGVTTPPSYNTGTTSTWGLRKAYLTNDITTLPNNFLNYSNISEVLYEENMQDITAGNNVFSYNNNIVALNLPFITSAGNSLCYNNNSLETVDLPSLTSAGDYLCRSNNSLKTVDLPSLTSAGDYLCGYNNSLETVDLPSLTSAGGNGFYDSNNITNINLGSRSNVLTLTTNLYLKSDYLTDASFLEVANALVDNTGGGTHTIYVKTTRWATVPQTTKNIFSSKNYTISES